MVEGGLTALVGLHDKMLVSAVRDALDYFGYKADFVTAPVEMIRLAQEKPYDCYLMDLNLGSPGGEDISPAESIYGIVKQRVESGRAKFLAISARERVVKAALAKGIPSKDKGNPYFNLIDWLEQ